jgi:alpha-tubulin suppressor-like RCC1 family protein
MLLSDTTVRCMGVNSDGQLGVQGDTPNQTPQPIAGLRGVTSLALGDDFSCAVLADRTVKCWGGSSFGQLGAGPLPDVLRSPPVAVKKLEGVHSLDAGNWHAVAVLDTGDAVFWGRNNVGQFADGGEEDRDIPTPSTTVAAFRKLALGGFHGCSLPQDGSVQCWGWNEYGQLGDGTAGKDVVRRAPVTVVGLTGVKDLALGENHSCALLADSTVRCWGSNELGQLGNGSRTASKTPVAVKDLTGVTELIAGGYHSCARLGDDTVRCWGSNGDGQIGDATTENRRVPTAVRELGPARQLAAGHRHSCALLRDDTVWCWGARASARPTRVSL